MPYTVCLTKRSPCCILPISVPAAPLCMRTLEVYGCTPDLTAGTKSNQCCQGTTQPVGCCCQWTVPSGVRQITVELWGAGGGGGSASADNCCGANPGGSAGSYVKKSIAVTPGDVVTICAGAGGCSGGGKVDSGSYCCCGGRGACSFVQINGTFCADAWGGDRGISECYYQCGCLFTGNGTVWQMQGSGTAECGCNSGCTNYTTDLEVIAGPSPSIAPGCGGYCDFQHTSGSASPFGSDMRWWGYSCNCWQYLRWNTSCLNSAGVYGPGGDPGPTSTAYNVGSNYACSTDTNWTSCDRPYSAPPAYFPGGGGSSGVTSSCCNRGGAGGLGAPGYVRIYY